MFSLDWIFNNNLEALVTYIYEIWREENNFMYSFTNTHNQIQKIIVKISEFELLDDYIATL